LFLDAHKGIFFNRWSLVAAYNRHLGHSTISPDYICTAGDKKDQAEKIKVAPAALTINFSPATDLSKAL